MNYLTTGIFAHVDSGKTTLSEALLYHTGILRKLGRVDHKDAFLDNNPLERERGITIFSKQAVLPFQDVEFTILDTPGHVDFSAEMERTLQVIDYAVLVVSGSEGIQSHTETLWKLLHHSHKPVFIFVNKMDLSLKSRAELMQELQKYLHKNCIDFSVQNDAFFEALATCDETLMNEVLDSGKAEKTSIAQAILQRHIFPCLFGSALKFQGIEEFASLLETYTLPLPALPDFGAKVFKITEDEQGNRLTHLKITGGELHVRDILDNQEKVNQIRIYSGGKFKTLEKASQGMVCAVTGLSQTYSGQGLGTEQNASLPVLEPILHYSVVLPEDVSVNTALIAFRKLEQQDPELHVTFSEQLQEIHLLLMGEIQLDVIQHILREKFHISAEFRSAGVAYKETISNAVEGMGHYEPLRHYAEVRLLLEPAPAGSGLIFSNVCREDELDRNWQRLILTHLKEKQHLGVLTGSPLTDVKITLTAGKAHKKHTEGGDFRQATYRAVRQGLMQAESVLLEPYYQFKLKVPSESLGRAITDLQLKGAKLESPVTSGEFSVLEGSAPAVIMMNYRTIFMEYTHGKGSISFLPAGYAPCHNPEEVIQKFAYQPEADIENSPDSIFCSHGSGNLIKWQDVPNYMHTESYLTSRQEIQETLVSVPVREVYTGSYAQDEELMKIFEQTYGKIQHDKRDKPHILHTEKTKKFKASPVPKGDEYLLVDGYNIIFSWDSLKKISAESLDSARAELIHRLSNYQGMRKCKLIIVFDAYKVKNNSGSIEEINPDIHIVYTKEAETADTYIERISHELTKEHRVRVATSDGAEQIIILGNGAYRMSAEELRLEVLQTENQIREYLEKL